MEYKSNTAYSATHKPTGETWMLLGINVEGKKVCAAGWPPTMANLSDCTDIEEMRELTKEEIKYRNAQFGSGWD